MLNAALRPEGQHARAPTHLEYLPSLFIRVLFGWAQATFLLQRLAAEKFRQGKTHTHTYINGHPKIVMLYCCCVQNTAVLQQQQQCVSLLVCPRHSNVYVISLCVCVRYRITLSRLYTYIRHSDRPRDLTHNAVIAGCESANGHVVWEAGIIGHHTSTKRRKCFPQIKQGVSSHHLIINKNRYSLQNIHTCCARWCLGALLSLSLPTTRYFGGVARTSP